MKLNDEQVQNVSKQTGLEPVPEDNPAVPKLQEHFGEHTFYLDANGLYIWEPVDDVEEASEAAAAIMLATWGDEEKTFLKPTPPTRSQVVVELAAVQ
jgi:hypothetical protein